MFTKERFLSDIGAGSRSEFYDELVLDYSVGRHYHGLQHISNCLDYFDSVAHYANNSPAVLAAIYYHDIVYDSQARDNEERSAEIAVDRLRRVRRTDMFCESVRSIIMATKHDGKAEGINCQVMCDVDLAELGADWATFSQNTNDIRKEYSWVNDEDWRKGRAGFMRGLLAREKLYYTPAFQKLFERRARENLLRSIQELEAA